MINKKIIIFINIIIGLLLIIFTIYRRIFVVRLPKSLYIFNDTINYVLLVTVILGFLICSYYLIITIRLIFLKNKFKRNFFTKLNDIIENALFEVYNSCANYIPDMFNKISLLAENFYALFHKRMEYTLLFLLFFIRLIIIIAFLIDIFIFFKFNYFYKALYLLCISLFIKIIIFILRDFANNLEDAESILIIEDRGIDSETQLPITTFKLKEEYKNLNLQYYIKQYILCSKLTGYFEMYDCYSKFFTPYFNFSIYLLYLIGWLYILYQNINY